MKKNYEWRWSRFCEPTCVTDYSGNLSFQKIAFLLVVIVSVGLVFSAKMCLLGALGAIIVLGFVLLAPICRPDEVVYLLKGKMYIFVKKVKSKTSYELIDSLHKIVYLASGYETFVQPSEKAVCSLVFKDSYAQSWYYICTEDKSPIELGKRLGQILFLTQNSKGENLLSIFQNGIIERMSVQNFFYNNFCTTVPLKGKSAPDELLLVKIDGNYKLYGLYLKEDSLPHYRELNYYDIGDMEIYFYENEVAVLLKCTENGIVKISDKKA